MAVSEIHSPDASDPNTSLFAGSRLVGIAALVLGVGSHAINGFVTSAVLPDIIREFGGQERAFWVFSSFQIMAIIAGCLTGAFKVRLGTRLPFLVAICILLGGSIMAGFSTSLEGLIFGRSLQGFGEGMIIALCYALIPDLFPSSLVPRVFAILAAVWAAAAGLGPVSAGLLTEAWSWRAAFLVNIPLAVLLFWLVNTALTGKHTSNSKPAIEDRPAKRHHLPLKLVLLLLAVLSLTAIGEFRSPALIALTVGLGIGLWAVLLRTDQSTGFRLFPRDAFKPQTIIGLGTWIMFLISIAAATRAVFITTFAQVYWGLGVTSASYAAALLAFSWSVFAWASSKAEKRETELRFLTVGPIMIVAGLGLTGVAVTLGSLNLFLLAAIVTGAGHGLQNQILTRSIMYSADGAEQGLVSSILPTISSAGIAIGGGVTGLLAILVGLVPVGETGLITRSAIGNAGPALFYVTAAIALIPAAATVVLANRLRQQEAR